MSPAVFDSAHQTHHGSGQLAISLLLCVPAHTHSLDYLLHWAQEYSIRKTAVAKQENRYFPPEKKKHQLVLHSNSVINMNQSACCVQYDTLNEYVAVTVGKRLSFSRVAPVPGDLCRLFRIPLSQQTALTRVRPARAANGPLTHFHRGRCSWK